MKRTLFWALLPVAMLLASCDDQLAKYANLIPKNGEMYAFQIGYDEYNTGSEYEELNQSKTSYHAFMSVEQMEQAAEYGSDMYDAMFGKGDGNYYPYSKETEGKGSFFVKVYPEETAVQNVSVSSSDESILKVTGVEGKTISFVAKTLGDVDLTVTVVGDKNTMTQTFPISVISECDLEFFIPPYWRMDEDQAGFIVELRCRAAKLPYGFESDIPIEYRDSLTVCASCTYYTYDEDKDYFTKHVLKDTIRHESETAVKLFHSGRMNFIRDITRPICNMQRKFIKSKHRNANTGEVEDYEYHYVVENVIVDFCFVSGNPWIDFAFAKKIWTHPGQYHATPTILYDIPKGKDFKYIESFNKDLVVDFSESTDPYVTIRPSSGSKNEADKLQQRLDDMNYSPDLSEEEKDSALDKINDLMND